MIIELTYGTITYSEVSQNLLSWIDTSAKEEWKINLRTESATNAYLLAGSPKSFTAHAIPDLISILSH